MDGVVKLDIATLEWVLAKITERGDELTKEAEGLRRRLSEGDTSANPMDAMWTAGGLNGLADIRAKVKAQIIVQQAAAMCGSGPGEPSKALMEEMTTRESLGIGASWQYRPRAAAEEALRAGAMRTAEMRAAQRTSLPHLTPSPPLPPMLPGKVSMPGATVLDGWITMTDVWGKSHDIKASDICRVSDAEHNEMPCVSVWCRTGPSTVVRGTRELVHTAIRIAMEQAQ